jgi:hypothetical protein
MSLIFATNNDSIFCDDDDDDDVACHVATRCDYTINDMIHDLL